MLDLLKKFKWYYWLIVILDIVLVYIQVTCDLELPDYISKIISVPLNPMITDKTEVIVEYGLKMFMYAAISLTSCILATMLACKLASLFSRDVRERMYKKVSNLSIEEMDKFQTASLITRSTNDVTQVQMLILMTLRMAVMAPLTAIKAISKASSKTNEMTFIIVIAVVFLVLFIFVLFMFVFPKIKLVQKLTDKLNLVTRENLTGLRVVRAYNAKDKQQSKFDGVNQKVTKNNTFINQTMSLMGPTMTLIMNGTSLSIVWVGAYLVNDKTMNFEDVFAFQQYSMSIIISFMMIIMLSIMIPRGLVSANRISEVLNLKEKIVDGTLDASLGDTSIEFKNVSFKYDDALNPVLNDINFTCKSGEVVAFIGSTGSGKSTLINLIPRFYDVSSGEILINDINIKDYKQKELRKLIGYVPQKGVLFSGSIEKNLQYGLSDATKEEMDEALRIAQATDFVSRYEDGLQHNIAQGGKNVSGGQKQRLSIARAIIKKPKIYIFDDSFSALDYKTDQVLRKELFAKTKESINIIVAQRIGTIIDADKIIVLDEGKIVGIGNHQELLQSCEVYKEIAYSQMTREELE